MPEDTRNTDERQAQARKDKVELLKLKQGITSDISAQEKPKKTMTSVERFRNYVDYYKFPVIFGVVFLLLFAYLIYSGTKDDADVYYLYLCNDYKIYSEYKPELDKLLTSCTELGDGIYLNNSMRYIPVNDTESVEMVQANRTKLFAEFQMGECVLVFADDTLDDIIQPEQTLLDFSAYLESDFLDSSGKKLYLEKTAFSELIGCGDACSDTLYVGIRAVREDETYSEEMRENVETALKTIKNLEKRL